MTFRTRAILATCFLLALTACDRLPGTSEFKARKAITSAMFDPDSAKFQYVVKTSKAVCGTINGKNRMGAYVGAKPFFYDAQTTEIGLLNDAPTVDDYRMYNDMPDGPQKNEKWEELESGCQFPAKWKKICGENTGISIPTNESFCPLFLSGNWSELYRQTHPSYY